MVVWKLVKKSMKRDIRDVKKDSLFANLALLFLYPYSFLAGLSSFQGIHIIYPAFALSVIILVYISLSCNYKGALNKFFTIQIGVSFFMLLNIHIVGNIDIKFIIYAVFIMPSLALLLFYYKIKRWVAYMLFYGVSLCFVLYIYQNGPFVGLENELLVNSRNYVSFFVILYSFPYYVHCSDNNTSPSLIPSIVCVVISVLAIGRAGIISSLVMMIVVLYINNTTSKRASLYRFLFFIIIMILVFVLDFDLFFDSYFSRFSEVGMDSYGRSTCVKEYLSSLMNPINLLFGTPVNTLRHTMTFQGGSLQNSYLALHAHEGIYGFFLIYLFIKGLFVILRNKYCNIMPAIAAIFLKGFSDSDMGGIYSGGDIVLYYVILIYFFGKKKNENKSTCVVPTTVSSNPRE